MVNGEGPVPPGWQHGILQADYLRIGKACLLQLKARSVPFAQDSMSLSSEI